MQLTYIFLLIFFLFIFFYIRKKYIKYKIIYQKNGLDGILYYFKNKNFKKTGFSNFVDNSLLVQTDDNPSKPQPEHEILPDL